MTIFNVSWNAPNPDHNIVSHTIQLSVNSGAFIDYNNVGVGVNAFAVTHNAGAGTPVAFRIVATNNIGASLPSAPVQTSHPDVPPAPTGVIVTIQ